MKRLILGALLFAFQASASTSQNVKPLSDNELNAAKEQFVIKTMEEFDLPIAFINKALDSAEYDPTFIKKITTPWEAKPWHIYRKIFIKDKRITEGLKFWNEYQTTLERAEKKYGVPPEIIVSILGVESYFGKHKGTYSVLNSLYTLGFHYPKRGRFFKSELRNFLALAHAQGFSLTQTKGSYAGAMGWGQFISSSYRHYAVDFDNDGKKDLFDNPVDAIGSIANYFAKNGWKKGQPVTYPATVLNSEIKKLVDNSSKKPKTKLAKLVQSGVRLDENIDLSLTTKTKLMSFEQPGNKDYWIGLHNFYVITRYNHSTLYAMAIHQLSEKIKQAR